jgi:hypothetical protein
MLCEFCRKLKPPHQSQRTLDAWKERRHSCLVRHHANFNDLIESAAKGCELCELFRPFVEYAQRKRARLVGEDEFDDGWSVGSPEFHDDPFEGGSDDAMVFTEPRQPTMRVTKDSIYVDEGDCYCWLNERMDDGNDAYEKELELILEKEREEDKAAGLLPTHDKSDDYAIIQWLCLEKGKSTSCEQIWIRGWTYYGDDDNRKGHAEASSIITLSAGSIDGDPLEEHTEFCIDDKIQISSVKDLAIEIPGLWKNPHDQLHLPREWPFRDLKPNFEFYQRRGMVLY